MFFFGLQIYDSFLYSIASPTFFYQKNKKMSVTVYYQLMRVNKKLKTSSCICNTYYLCAFKKNNAPWD